MVGREAESAVVLGLTSGVLIVTGEPGAGKSTLLQLAADAHGGRVLRMTGSESERNLPFAGLHQLLRPVLTETTRLPERQRTALLGAIGVEAPGPPDRLLLGVALLTLLSELAQQTPVLVVADDLQWIDAGSLDALAFVARRIDAEPLAVLGAMRGDPGTPGPATGIGVTAHTESVGTRHWAAAGGPYAVTGAHPGSGPRGGLAGGSCAGAGPYTATGPSPETGPRPDPAGGPSPETGPHSGTGPRPETGPHPPTTTPTATGPSHTAAALSAFPTLPLGPLDTAAAGALLDRQPRPPTGRRRVRILDQAAGNPLALVELARTDCADEDLLPLTDRLTRLFAVDLQALPEETRHALLLVAVDDLAVGGRAEALAPAESAGLLRIAGGRVRFRHPLVRSAIYHSVPLAVRRRAHRELAASLTGEPDRRAWHLAAAADGPDEPIAAALEESAARARERGGHAAAATALERAAELSPRRYDRARRLVAAAGAAVYTGQPHWVRQLAARAGETADDPALAAEASLRVGQVLTLTAEHGTALTSLMRAADDPDLRRIAIASASVAGFYSGDEDHRRAVRARAADDPWTLAVTGPTERRAELAAALPGLVEQAEGDPGLLTSLGAMAWLLDETALAVRIFDDALHRWRMRGALPTGLGCSAGWAYLDHGRWAEARLAAAGSASLGAGLPHLNAAVRALDAAVLALAGDTAEAREVASAGLSLVDPGRSRAVAVRTRWALGMAAVAEGDQVTAYEHFRHLFTTTGDPVHYACSYAGLAELAAAAVRTGHADEAADIVERSAKRLAPDPSPRMRALIHRAQALLAPAEAEPHFTAALADPVGEQWPFERAQILLDYAEWLRRRHRVTDARPKFHAAMEIFRRLGARPWITRTRTELRAAGINPAPTTPDALTSLTPQQQHIIRLAAQGLSNREIGERLFLSPRTVGSHLYRSFPKLGVTSRAQLRDVVEASC